MQLLFSSIKLLLSLTKYIIPFVCILILNYSIHIDDIAKLQSENDYKTSFTGNILISDEFTEEEVSIIIEAASDWEVRTKGLVDFNIIREPFIKIDYNESIILLKASEYDPYVIISDKIAGCKKCTYALTQRDFYVPNIKFFPNRIPNNDMFYTVVLHELGHYLGMDHLEDMIDSKSLMYFNAQNIRKEITKRDLVYFCEVYQCLPEKKKEILNDKENFKLFIK